MNPTLVPWWKLSGMIKRARIHLRELWQVGIHKKKRAAAIGTEGTDAPGKTDFAGCSFGPAQRILREKSPCDRGCPAGLAAVLAMAKAGLHGRSVHFVADRAAEAAALVCDQFRHGEQVLDPTNTRQEVVVPR